MATMGALLGLVNRLQEVCTLLGDHAGAGDRSLPTLWDALPSLVVIGGQSSGKSSVLESVVGRDFLPRGSGIVTRRPLVLQLTQGAPGSPEWGEFLHKPGKKFSDFDAMRGEIEEETARTCAGVAVSPEAIHLHVTSPNVPNITMVDMPGLTKIAVEGQPKTIVKDIEDMARKYVEGKNAIILAVTPANADIATSDALRLAREVDPAGERTVGVLTKLDIMDRGTNARDVLEGYAAPLRHGWVAVVNRAQADINSQVTMEQARQSERAFFESKAEYRGLTNCGMAALTSKLTRKLEEAIVRQIPVIQNTINDGVQTIQRELKQYGTNVPDNRGAMVHEVLTLCRAFEQAYGLSLESGEGGGEAVLSIFETDLTQAIQQLPFKDVYSLQNVSRVINEADGYQPHLIAPEMGYRRLIECGLTLLKEPSEGVVDKVYIVLRNLVDKVLGDPENDNISRYGPLKGEICEQAARALEGMRDNSKKMVVTMVEMESSYLTAEFFREIIAADASGTAASAVGDAHLKQIAKHVSSYLAVVCNQLKATIPKAIVHCLVVQAKTALLDGFLQEVAGMEDESLKGLLAEDDGVRARREMCHKRLEMLTMASKEINIALGKAR